MARRVVSSNQAQFLPVLHSMSESVVHQRGEILNAKLMSIQSFWLEKSAHTGVACECREWTYDVPEYAAESPLMVAMS